MVKIFWEFFPLPFFFLFTILIKEPKHNTFTRKVVVVVAAKEVLVL